MWKKELTSCLLQRVLRLWWIWWLGLLWRGLQMRKFVLWLSSSSILQRLFCAYPTSRGAISPRLKTQGTKTRLMSGGDWAESLNTWRFYTRADLPALWTSHSYTQTWGCTWANTHFTAHKEVKVNALPKTTEEMQHGSCSKTLQQKNTACTGRG